MDRLESMLSVKFKKRFSSTVLNIGPLDESRISPCFSIVVSSLNEVN